ncbi:MAG: amidase, partial [Chloroflexi bacterium]|nr:amidase [Chloroflexota bacterium]
MTPKVEYDLKSVKLPYLAGLPLRLFVALLESPLRGLLIPSLLDSAGISRLREQRIDEPPVMCPLRITGEPVSQAGSVPQAEWPGPPARPGPGFRFATAHDYARAYREGKTTPDQVARKVLAAIEASNSADPPLRAIIAVEREDVLKQAAAATKRIQEGRALSIFDGVPVAVKDEVDMAPYPTTVGTAFLGKSPAAEDSTVVARMRAAGALLIGKANMHEIGIGVTGLNPHHGTTRNPYNPAHYSGGSSSGPGAAVASGFCPVAIGADGGGSIRIPSSFCGLVGLKPTFGRVSEFGA